jgi:hypothetical protein
MLQGWRLKPWSIFSLEPYLMKCTISEERKNVEGRVQRRVLWRAKMFADCAAKDCSRLTTRSSQVYDALTMGSEGQALEAGNKVSRWKKSQSPYRSR